MSSSLKREDICDTCISRLQILLPMFKAGANKSRTQEIEVVAEVAEVLGRIHEQFPHGVASDDYSLAVDLVKRHTAHPLHRELIEAVRQ